MKGNKKAMQKHIKGEYKPAKKRKEPPKSAKGWVRG